MGFGFSLSGSKSKAKSKSATDSTFKSNTQASEAASQEQTSFTQALQDSVSASQATQATDSTTAGTSSQVSRGATTETGRTRGTTSGEAVTAGARTTDAVQTTTQLDAASKAALDSLVGVLGSSLDLSGSGVPAQFSKEQALLDSTAIFEGALQASAEEIFPQLIDLQNQTGTFNNTTAQLLRDKKQAQAQREAAKLQVDVISEYASIAAAQQGLGQSQSKLVLDSLLGSLGLEAQAVQSTTSTGQEATTEAQATSQVQDQITESAQATEQVVDTTTREATSAVSVSEELAKTQVASTEEAEAALVSERTSEEDVNQSGTSTTTGSSKGSNIAAGGSFSK